MKFNDFNIQDLQLGHSCEINPSSGDVSASVTIPLPQGRNGFGPSLSLNYSSSSGNSAFGMGWNLGGIDYISIDTRKGLPKYDGSDNFAFNGSMPLVPQLVRSGSTWVERIDENSDYWIYYYRPGHENAFTRYEKWVSKAGLEVHWRTRSKNNILSIYGMDPSGESIISDPENRSKKYIWLLESRFDQSGNAVKYIYKEENGANTDPLASHESNRLRKISHKGFAQKYPERIQYGNSIPAGPGNQIAAENKWFFEIVFDYGEYGHRPYTSSHPESSADWEVRPDPFSVYRPGFEIRTYRLCNRILVYHNFDQLSTTASLTGIFKCGYDYSDSGSTLKTVLYTGVRKEISSGHYSEKELPPLTFKYSRSSPGNTFRGAARETGENLPRGFNNVKTRMVDLHGDGLPGILTETDNTWYYKPNLGEGIFGRQEIVGNKPSQELGIYYLGDFDRDGNMDLYSLQGRMAGYYEYDRNRQRWSGFRALQNIPQTGHSEFMDVDADGFPDLVIEREDKIICYPFKGKEGFQKPWEFAKPISNGSVFTATIGNKPALDYFMADMTGDGLPDQVRIQNGRVEYYPNMGNGHFGEVVLMENSPVFDFDASFDPGRIRLHDLNGSGTADILYIGNGEIRYWYNSTGNKLNEGSGITGLPYIDNLSSAVILDFLGQGKPCLVWSDSSNQHKPDSLQYLELATGIKPGLLISMDNGMGKEVLIEYGYSGRHYLEARKAGRPWLSKIPGHFTVADKKTVIDQITNSHYVTYYKYFDGHYDGTERSFVTFGLVEQYDTELYHNATITHNKDYTQPLCVKTWFHNGLFGWDPARTGQFYNQDPGQPLLVAGDFEQEYALDGEDFETGYRTLAGKIIRQEIYAANPPESPESHPYRVLQNSYRIRQLQPKTPADDPCFYVYLSETLTINYEQEAGDPNISHQISVAVNEYGEVEKELTVAYARRNQLQGRLPAQARDYVTAVINRYSSADAKDKYRSAILYESQTYEINHLDRRDDEILKLKDLQAAFDDLISNALDFDQPLDPAGVSVARINAWSRTFFWNDTQTDVLPLGQTGKVILTQHEEIACFNNELIDQAFNGKVTPAMLSDVDEGNYILKDGYWWQRTDVNHFKSSSGFYLPDKVEKRPGVFTSYEYDDYFLRIIQITDPFGNKTKGEMDYNLVEPCRLTDVNDNVSEVLYDALGVTVVTTNSGTVLHNGSNELYGYDQIDTYSRRNDESFDNIIANPELYLQNSSTFIYIDVNNFPLRSIRLTRENLLHDGKGNVNNVSAIQIDLDYQDGFGRIIQNKRKVEPGPAIHRDADGSVITDAAGEPVFDQTGNRWLVSGHVVYNNKQLPIRQFEPFFSDSHQFESDTLLEKYGLSVQKYYDALGRMYRTDFPDSTFAEMLFSSWGITSFDQNDTVDRSMYKVFRELQPPGSPARMALDKSLPHQETPTIMHFDPLGREIVRIETNNNGAARKIETEFDINGNPLQITDARDLKAFEYKRDMPGRLLYEKSMDAGEKWSFHNNDDQSIHIWDSRSVHQRIHYDALDRVTTIRVDGALGLNHITERFVYGEDASLAQTKEKNLRGALVIHYDQAGVQELKLAAPGNMPLHTERKLADQFTLEPDWTNPPAVSLAPDIFTTQNSYDGLGRLIEQHLPDQTTREYEFNQGGGLQKILLTTADGELNNVPILKSSGYDAKGMRQSVLLGNDVETEYTYDTETFRLKRLRSRKIAETPRTYQDIKYTYDPVGNLVHLADEAQQPAAPDPHALEGLNVSAHSEFEYDAFYQLKSAKGRVHQSLLQNDYAHRSLEADLPANWGRGTRHITLNNGAAVERYIRTYEYDEAGNIKTIRHSGTSQNWTKQIWTSATSNRSLPLMDLNDASVSNPESRFDANGNCVYMPHLRSLEWNYRNNISRAVIIDRSSQGKPNDEEYYLYGGDGLRVRKISQRLVDAANDTIELTEKIYLYGCEIKRITRDGTEILKHFTSTISDGDHTFARIHSWEKDTLARETDDVTRKNIHYQLANHLGSSSLELDENGDVITYEEYFPYGGTSFIAGRNKKEIDLKDYRYSGKERDDLTGLYYYGYRYYAHWIGNWMSPDPAGPVDGLNLYQFVMNNPMNLLDFSGLQSAEPENLPEFSARIPFSEYGIHEYDFLIYSQNGERLFQKAAPMWDGEGPVDIMVVNGSLSEEMFLELYGDELIALTDAMDSRTREEPAEEPPGILTGSEEDDTSESAAPVGREDESTGMEDETVITGEAEVVNETGGQAESVNEAQSSDDGKINADNVKQEKEIKESFLGRLATSLEESQKELISETTNGGLGFAFLSGSLVGLGRVGTGTIRTVDAVTDLATLATIKYYGLNIDQSTTDQIAGRVTNRFKDQWDIAKTVASNPVGVFADLHEQAVSTLHHAMMGDKKAIAESTAMTTEIGVGLLGASKAKSLMPNSSSSDINLKDWLHQKIKPNEYWKGKADTGPISMESLGSPQLGDSILLSHYGPGEIYLPKEQTTRFYHRSMKNQMVEEGMIPSNADLDPRIAQMNPYVNAIKDRAVELHARHLGGPGIVSAQARALYKKTGDMSQILAEEMIYLRRSKHIYFFIDNDMYAPVPSGLPQSMLVPGQTIKRPITAAEYELIMNYPDLRRKTTFIPVK